MNSVPILHTSCCALTAIIEDDIPILHRIMDDEDSKRFLPELYEFVSSDGGWKNCIKSFQSYVKINQGFLWGIRLNTELIGFIAITDIPVEPIVFYAMHPNYRNQHHMEQALSVVIQFMVSKRFCSFVKTEVDADNIKSVKVLESAKFHFVHNNEAKSMYIKKLI